MSVANGLSGRRILVVEDEVMVSWLLEDMLEQMGCTVVGPVARVDQALAIIDDEEIDAAILDVNLNGVKSYPIADALAACAVPFVFSTGYGRKGLQDRYADVPMLQKPYKCVFRRSRPGIPISSRPPFRREGGHRSDLKPATAMALPVGRG